MSAASKIKILKYPIIFLISCAYLFFAISSSLEKSATYDESIIISSGYNFIKNLDSTINSENPIFLKSILALPLLCIKIKQPEKIKNVQYSYKNDIEVKYGNLFLYNNGAEIILFLCRMMNIIIGLIGGIFILLLLRLFVKKSWGVLGYALFLFCPNIIANSSIATVDIGVTVFILATEYFMLLSLREGALRYYILTGLFAGFSMLSKYSGILILVIIPLQVIIYIIFKHRNPVRLLGKTVLSLFICILIINIAYGNYCLTNIDEVRPKSSLLCEISKIPLITHYIPLPYNYLKGFDIVAAINKSGIPNVYMGTYYPEGGHWNDYYFFISLFKIPIPILLMILIGFVYTFYMYWRKWIFYYLLIPVFITYYVYSFVAFSQLGIRYVLISFPYLIIVSVIGMRFIYRNLKAKFIFFSIISWFFFESCIIAYPNYLTYFNEIAGGPIGGKKYFANSDLDWGQDILGLKIWLMKNGNPPIAILYFGGNPIEYYGISQSNNPKYFVVGVSSMYHMKGKYYSRLMTCKPFAVIGNSIYIYPVKSNSPIITK